MKAVSTQGLGQLVRFEVLTAARMKVALLWLPGLNVLMMEVASTSETSINFSHTARSNNPETAIFIRPVCVRSHNIPV
jgi:hypothetical protein